MCLFLDDRLCLYKKGVTVNPYQITLLSDRQNTIDFLHFLTKAGDFCGAFNNPKSGKDIQSASTYLERRGPTVFVAINRGRFVGVGAPCFSWAGDYTKFLEIFSGPKELAEFAIKRFVSTSKERKDHENLMEALDAIKYAAIKEVFSGTEFFINMVPAAQDAARGRKWFEDNKAAQQSKPKQLRLF